MQLQDLLARLQEVDLDVANIGAWPCALRLALLAAFAVALLAAGGVLHVVQQTTHLAAAERREAALFADYRRLHTATVDVEQARTSRNDAAERFESLLAQLPRDAEVPALIDDISQAALSRQLTIERITLGEERATTSYVELPIDIAVAGGYHDLGAFLEALARLPRILAPGDFTLRQRDDGKRLQLTMRVRTWRRRATAGDAT